MKEHDATELAYKKGYAAGYEAGKRDAVKHGWWIAVPSSDMTTGNAYKCSECNKMRFGSFMPNYCPNCGADMRGDQK